VKSVVAAAKAYAALQGLSQQIACSMESATLCRMDSATRLVVLGAAGCALLLHVRDLSKPQFGIEPGETYTQTALHEETGINVGTVR
jgi:hypothetical protein